VNAISKGLPFISVTHVHMHLSLSAKKPQYNL